MEQAGGKAVKGPVFVLGVPSVGVSLLATSLTAGDEFWCSGELHVLYGLVGPDEEGKSKLYKLFEQASLNDSFWLSRNKVLYPEFAESMGRGLDSLVASRAGGKRWVDASPENIWIAADVALLFPRAQFISVVRGPRSSIAEMLQGLNREPTNAEFRSACETWSSYAARAVEFRRAQTPNVFELRYEDLGDLTSSVVRRLVGFLGAKRDRPVSQFLSENKEAFVQTETSNWDEAKRAIFLDVVGESMKGLGYEETD